MALIFVANEVMGIESALNQEDFLDNSEKLESSQRQQQDDSTNEVAAKPSRGTKRLYSGSSDLVCSFSSIVSISNKRQNIDGDRKPTKRVHFHPHNADQESVEDSMELIDELQLQVQIYTYEKYSNLNDIWWSKEEFSSLINHHHSLLSFFQNNCEELVDAVLMLWVNCAEVALGDDVQCMTPTQRAAMAQKIALSPIRGFERCIAGALTTEQRQKSIQGILELQTLCGMCQTAGLARMEVLAEASDEFSRTAVLFAKSLADADAHVAAKSSNQ